VTFVLDEKSGVPFYRQVIDQIRFAVARGNLKPGDQLPTVRALAAELSINLNTVAKAYNELMLSGWLVSQQGTGTFIGATEVKMSRDERQKKVRELANEFIAVASAYGISAAELATELGRPESGKSKQ